MTAPLFTSPLSPYTTRIMLKKRERLTAAMFDRFFSSGRRVHGTYVQLVYTPFPQFHGAVVVGKKLLRSAVARNKLRRRIYAALYSVRRTEDMTGVYILLAKPPAITAPYGALADEIRMLAGRVSK